MTIRELIDNGYHFQSSHKLKTIAMNECEDWRKKGYIVACLFVATSGKWEVWVK